MVNNRRLSWAVNRHHNSYNHLAYPDQPSTLCGTGVDRLYRARIADKSICLRCLNAADRNGLAVPGLLR